MGHDKGCRGRGRTGAAARSALLGLVPLVLDPSSLFVVQGPAPSPPSPVPPTPGLPRLSTTHPGSPREGQGLRPFPVLRARQGGCPSPPVTAGTCLLYPTARWENPRLIGTDEKAEAQRGEGFCPGARRGHGQSKALGAEAASSDRSGPGERGVGREEGLHFPEAWDSKMHAWPGADGKAPEQSHVPQCARGCGAGRLQSQGSLEAFLGATAEPENFRVGQLRNNPEVTLGLASTIRVGVALGRRGILGSQTPGPHLSLAELQGQKAPGPVPGVQPALSESTDPPTVLLPLRKGQSFGSPSVRVQGPGLKPPQSQGPSAHSQRPGHADSS